MNPLQLRIVAGLEDNNLLDHIRRLEWIRDAKDGSVGLSPGERVTLVICYQRLSKITEPVVM